MRTHSLLFLVLCTLARCRGTSWVSQTSVRHNSEESGPITELTYEQEKERMVGNWFDKVTCYMCEGLIHAVDKLLEANATITTVEAVADWICPSIAHKSDYCPKPLLSWQCEDVCRGMVQQMGHEMDDLFVMRFMTPSLVCNHIGSKMPFHFECPTPAPVPQPTPQKDVIYDKPTAERKPATGSGYIVLLPDIHMDPFYAVGAVANCGEPICCRVFDDNKHYDHNVTYAGLFGDSADCDAPPILVDSLFDFIQTQVPQVLAQRETAKLKQRGVAKSTVESDINGADLIDFAVWVGDGPPHDVWNQSQSYNVGVVKDLMSRLDKMSETLAATKSNSASMTTVPVYMALGNHDTFPVNQIESNAAYAWMLRPVSQLEAAYIDGGLSAKDSVLPSAILEYGGFYTALVRDGLRILTLATTYITDDNYYYSWAHADSRTPVDVASQRAWAKSILAQSRALNESVFVVTHHCLSSLNPLQQTAWYQLLDDYKDVVRVIFAGHTHVDTWHLLGYDVDSNSGAFTYTLNAGSVTPSGGRWPQFRVYEYDRANNRVTDYLQFHFDLDKANALKKPQWHLAYSMKEHYGMKSFTPSALAALTTSFATSDQLWNQYTRNYLGGFQHGGELNRNSTICRLLSATDKEHEHCTSHHFFSTVQSTDTDPYKN